MADVKELNINNTTYDIKAKTIVDNNGTKLSMWSGTKQEYDNITTKDPNQLYLIEDDTDVTLALLELLFPIGAVYFGTMSTCPLQVLGVGTWQALPSDKVIQIAGTRGNVGTTINESLPNPNLVAGGSHTHGLVMYSPATGSSGGSNWFVDAGTKGTNRGNTWTTESGGVHTHEISNSTYQDNAPVQQDAYLLNGWRRIA